MFRSMLPPLPSWSGTGSFKCLPPAGISAEKFSPAGLNGRHCFGEVSVAQAVSGSAGRAQASDGGVAEDAPAEADELAVVDELAALFIRAAVISVRFVSSDSVRFGVLAAGVTAFTPAAGSRRCAFAFVNSHGAIGCSPCHKPRFSFRAANSD